MPRAAGDSDSYTLHVTDGSGNPVGLPLQPPSVTTILSSIPKFGLDWWGYRMGLDQGRKHGPQHASLNEEAFYEEVKRMGREGGSAAALTPMNSLDDTSERGSLVHSIAENLLKHGPDSLPAKADVPADEHGYVESLVKWYDAHVKDKLHTVHVEVPVVSVQYWFGGTLDAILYDKATNIYYIIDFKTSKKIYLNHLLQSTTYEHAAKEHGYIPKDCNSVACVVRLKKGGRIAEVKNSPCNIEHFVIAYKMWTWMKWMEGKEVSPSTPAYLLPS